MMTFVPRFSAITPQAMQPGTVLIRRPSLMMQGSFQEALGTDRGLGSIVYRLKGSGAKLPGQEIFEKQGGEVRWSAPADVFRLRDDSSVVADATMDAASIPFHKNPKTPDDWISGTILDDWDVMPEAEAVALGI